MVVFRLLNVKVLNSSQTNCSYCSVQDQVKTWTLIHTVVGLIVYIKKTASLELASPETR